MIDMIVVIVISWVMYMGYRLGFDRMLQQIALLAGTFCIGLYTRTIVQGTMQAPLLIHAIDRWFREYTQNLIPVFSRNQTIQQTSLRYAIYLMLDSLYLLGASISIYLAIRAYQQVLLGKLEVTMNDRHKGTVLGLLAGGYLAILLLSNIVINAYAQRWTWLLPTVAKSVFVRGWIAWLHHGIFV